jgi:hypothetical protein
MDPLVHGQVPCNKNAASGVVSDHAGSLLLGERLGLSDHLDGKVWGLGFSSLMVR